MDTHFKGFPRICRLVDCSSELMATKVIKEDNLIFINTNEAQPVTTTRGRRSGVHIWYDDD